jgi:AraC-like DNA-binding protein
MPYRPCTTPSSAIDDTLDAETRLALVADAIRSALGAPLARSPLDGQPRGRPCCASTSMARLFERVTLAAAAGTIGSGAAHLARSFTDAFGIAPHRYVIGRRLDAARDRILVGQPLADVAARDGVQRSGSPDPRVPPLPRHYARGIRGKTSSRRKSRRPAYSACIALIHPATLPACVLG